MQSARAGIAALLVFSACAVFSPSAALSPTHLHIDHLENGYLLRIGLDREARDVSAIVAKPNWLIVTIPDTLIDTSVVARYRTREVDSTEVSRFETATQFSFRFLRHVSAVEVLYSTDRHAILLSVFY